MTVTITNGIKTIKESDSITTIDLLVTDGAGLAVDFSTANSVKVVLANDTGKILEKDATLKSGKGQLSFKVGATDVTGNGAVYLEIHVTRGADKQIFPNSGYLKIKIAKNLNALGIAVPTLTLETFRNQFNSLRSEINALASNAGDSNSEIVQARVGYDGTVFNTIKQRIDAELLGRSGSPRGVFSSFSLLNATYPTGNTGIYVVTADGKWYFWNGTAWIAGGVYQATQIPDSSVSSKKVTFVETGKNLFDNSILTDGRVNSTGGFTVDTTNKTAEMETIEPNTTYYANKSVFLNEFNDAQQFLRYTFISASGTITTLSNTKYIRISTPTANTGTLQFEKGTVGTGYEPYRRKFKGIDIDEIVAARYSGTKATTYSSLTSRIDAIETDLDSIAPSPVTATDAQAEAAFVDMMNKKAVLLGCTDANFSNSSGLSAAGQLTNPRDFGLIARHAIGIEELAKVWGCKAYTVLVKGPNARSVNITTSVSDATFEADYTILGGKTGTLGVVQNLAVIAMNKSSKRIYGGVILKADANRWVAMKELMDEANRVLSGNPSASPTITSVGACAFNIPTHPLLFTTQPLEELYLKGLTSKQSPASLTKILTAIVAIENMDNLNDVIEYKASDAVEDTLVFSAGDKVTIREALYLMMLQSNNTTAKAMARTIGQLIIKKRKYI